MIKPNLSLEALTSSLAALAAGTLVVACAASPAPSPVSAKEVPAQQGQKSAGHASCSAAGCSVNANAKGPEVSTTSAPAEAAPAAPAASAAPSAPAAPAVAASPTKAPVKSPAKKPAAGHSSCGAGTCSASK